MFGSTFGRNCGRPWRMQLSDAWFYVRHPVLFYRELWLPWKLGGLVMEV